MFSEYWILGKFFLSVLKRCCPTVCLALFPVRHDDDRGTFVFAPLGSFQVLSLSLVLNNFTVICLVTFFIVLLRCTHLCFSSFTSAVNRRHCRLNFWKFYFDLFTSSMSPLNIFILFSSFLNIWNTVTITALMSVFTNSVICVVSWSVSAHCFFLIMSHIFLGLTWLVIFEWILGYWIFTSWVLDNLYSNKYFELSFEIWLFGKFNPFCYIVPEQHFVPKGGRQVLSLFLDFPFLSSK